MNTTVNVSKLIELNKQIKELEKEFDPMKKQLIEDMMQSGALEYEENGTKFKLALGTTWSKLDLTVGDRIQLQQLGLDGLVTSQYVLSKEIAEAWIGQGKVTADTLKQFVSISETKRLTIK